MGLPSLPSCPNSEFLKEKVTVAKQSRSQAVRCLFGSINSLCGLGQVTVPLWASNEEGALVNVYGSFCSNDSSVDAFDLRHRLWHIVVTADSCVTTVHSERSLFVHILELQTPTETELHVHIQAENENICLVWRWLKKQYEPSLSVSLLPHLGYCPHPPRNSSTLTTGKECTWYSHTVLTPMGLDTVLKVRVVVNPDSKVLI